MASRRLARTGLEESLVHHLSARNINSAKELLDNTPLDLSEVLDCTEEEASRILSRVACAVCPEAHTVAQMWARRALEAHHLPFGLRVLDEALRGGVPCGTVTELVGGAGAGKTQLCTQLAIACQLPVVEGGLGGGCVYVDTEARFSGARLVEIARARWPERFASELQAELLTRGVTVFTPSTSSELLQRLEGLEAVIIERAAKLVIVDSVAALVRAEYGRERLVERQALLGEQASRLKQLAEAFRIPVVVTNQVTTRQQSTGSSRLGGFTPAHPSERAGDAHLAAALGTKWAHDVNLRIALETGEHGQRCLTISKSSAAAALSFPFDIGAGGVFLTAAPYPAAQQAEGAIAGGATTANLMPGGGYAAAFFSP